MENNKQQNNKNKMPGFNLSWLYLAIIVGLGIMLYQGNLTGSGGTNKEVDYTAWRNYVKQGVAREVVVNKGDGNVRLVVKPEHIRAIFKTGSDQTGTAPSIPRWRASTPFSTRIIAEPCATKRATASS